MYVTLPLHAVVTPRCVTRTYYFGCSPVHYSRHGVSWFIITLVCGMTYLDALVVVIHRLAYKIRTHNRFQRTLIYYDIDTQSAHFRGNPLCQATKRHLNNS